MAIKANGMLTDLISVFAITEPSANTQQAENHDDIDDNKYSVYNEPMDTDYKHDIDLSQALPQRRKRQRRGDRKPKEAMQSSVSIERAPRKCKYEYLDHTADIQLHAWGSSLKEAFEQVGIAMFGYMTKLDTVNYVKSHDIEATGHDLESLLYNYLSELLVAFFTENNLLFRDVEITEIDTKEWRIKATGYGEEMDIYGKHPQGTEVKAVTYSAMQIKQTDDKCECWVVVDI